MAHKNVLKWVNKVRKEYLDKPPIKVIPKGIRGSSSRCALHNCFWRAGKGGLMRNFALLDRNRNIIVFAPKHVRTFIERFDKGHFPDLIKEGSA